MAFSLTFLDINLTRNFFFPKLSCVIVSQYNIIFHHEFFFSFFFFGMYVKL